MSEIEKREIEKEVRNLRKAVSCSQVVTIMGVALDPIDDGINIIMEYMTEGNLKKLTPKLLDLDKDTWLTWPLRIRMILDMVLGMNYLHTIKPKPLIHRDLKLENVFVTQDFNVKVRCKIKLVQACATRAASLVVLILVDVNLFDLGGAMIWNFRDGDWMIL